MADKKTIALNERDSAAMLQQCGADERESERVQWLIAHHHTYTAGEEKDFRILLPRAWASPWP